MDHNTRERPRRGVRDGGDRVASLTRWLGQTLKQTAASYLVLTQRIDDEWVALGQWERPEVTPELARDVSELCQDAADETATHVQLRLQWFTADDKIFVQKALRAWPAGSSASGIVESLDGSTISMLAQNQRHLEAANQSIVVMARQQDEKWERVFAVQNEFMERLVGRLDLAEQAAEQARAERDEATELAAEAAQTAEEANERADQVARDDKLGKVFEIGMKQISEHAGGK